MALQFHPIGTNVSGALEGIKMGSVWLATLGVDVGSAGGGGGLHEDGGVVGRLEVRGGEDRLGRAVR